MRVIFLNHSSAPDHLGGSERSLLRLVEEWIVRDPDFEPHFFTRDPGGRFTAALDERGWGYTSFRFRWWVLPLANPSTLQLGYFAREDYAAVSEMARVMTTLAPDLVVTNTIIAPWAAFAAKSLGLPHAWFVREYGDLDHGLSFQFGRDATLSDIGLLSEAVVANSIAIRDHLAQYLPAEKISVTYPPVDVPRLRVAAEQPPATTPFPQSDPGLKITVVGRLSQAKGQWRVIEALGLLRERGVVASVNFVGAQVEADEEARLRSRATELGIAFNVLFAGEQDNPFPYIAAADVCVTPSGHEAFGRTTLEYLALGKPVVATRTGGSVELIDAGATGYLSDPDDIGGLADHLARYAASASLLAEHGAAARVRADALVEAHETSIPATIERLSALVGAPAYRLPNVARFWFDLPSLTLNGAPSGTLTVAYAANRLLSMTRTFIRSPVRSLRLKLQSRRT
jgi:glycosyltransferase involved in cell wall biosynthesis